MLTEAQKRYHRKMQDRALEAASKGVAETHRMKVGAHCCFHRMRYPHNVHCSHPMLPLQIEKFNSMLAELTEHNDIPRISAAGNG